MFRSCLLVLLSLLVYRSASATGVAVVDASKAIYLRLDTSIVSVKVDGQVARVKAYFAFTNTDTAGADISFAFPVPNGCRVSGLRFRFGADWTATSLVAQKQDTAVPASGPSIDQNFVNYLGATPLIFDIPGIVAPDSTVAVELEYVQLLPYELGAVQFSYPADYRPIQRTAVAYSSFLFELSSKRLIDTLDLTTHQETSYGLTQHTGLVSTEATSTALTKNYSVYYRLNSSDLGLFGYSTFLDSTCDGRPKGVMLFIAEPDGSESVEAIDKTFTLVIDRSGSMSGTKMVQARDAASFIMKNLNAGDKFNLVSFDNVINTFRPSHVDYNATTLAEALSYINGLAPGGSTNIHDALETALNQFPVADPSRASIIIFFTDGQANAGKFSTNDGICTSVKKLNAGKDVILFCFGIGASTNTNLLTRLASENGGLAAFVNAGDLYTAISNFYLRIRNPMLLDPVLTFQPPVVDEIYPRHLPNLYKGQQMLVTGRYSSAASPLSIRIDGLAYGKPVSYTYTMDLADTLVPDYAFLPKIWAKMKIEDLMVDYNLLQTNSPPQDSVKREVIETSLCFNVASEFTSFQIKWGGNWGQDTSGNGGGGPAGGVETLFGDAPSGPSIIAYPNPFSGTTELTITVVDDVYTSAEIYIYDLLGRHVRTLSLAIQGNDSYTILWDGKDEAGNALPAGTYIVFARINNEFHSGQLMKH